MTLAAPQTAAPVCNAENPQPPSLLTIPRELRDAITAPFLRSGDLVILCICRMITEEALQRIRKEATFRVYLDIKDRENTVLDRSSIPADLRNVEIHFNLYFGANYRTESVFDSSSIRKLSIGDYGVMDRCHITIYYDRGSFEEVPSFETLDARNRLKDMLPRGPWLLPMLSFALSGYTYFNTLVIQIVRDPLHKYWKLSSEDRLSTDVSDFGVLRRKLEPALGSAQFINSDGDCHLEFHPRAYSSSRSDPPIKMNLTATRCRPWYPPYSIIMDFGKGVARGDNIRLGPTPGYSEWPWSD